MTNERSVFAQNGPAGFPNSSEIRTRIQSKADTSAVEFWEKDFGKFAQAVLQTVKTYGKCSENQANVIAKECMLVASRRLRGAMVQLPA